ncbi:IRK-interacting protein isoform X2 [Brachypodium distachyon]|uniref:IRK-interacting protein isoform X2 n=1 Tax=Brachypodium distachyon TaxID=15368 RepID=UPI000D0DBBE2|nr:IRK-interacting protein isoform X2 [Brachypodium distachyon]|eukprot:XP_024316420.1 IRK-interacting protein isoform X2 [Brachypodium distachyon]
MISAYSEEPLGGMNYIRQDNRSLSENWSGIGLDHEGPEDEVAFSDLDNHNTFSSSNSELHFSSSNEHMRSRITRRNHPSSFLHPALSADSLLKSASRRTDLAESKAVTTCNACKPATISRAADTDANALKNLSSEAPLSNYNPSVSSRTRQKGTHMLAWLLPKSKRKTKSDMSPNTTECENMSQLLKEWGVFSLESLKKELAEANEHRDAALQEAGEMRSSLGELTSKLLGLEAYCSELKKALKKATSTKSMHSHSKRSARSSGISRDDSLPVSHEVMVEGFLQIVSEARLSIKQFCKVLIQQVDDADNGLSDRLNVLLQPYQLALTEKPSKLILYHLEALMNQAMYQDFENCTFQKNGSPRCLDPKQDLQENFASFVALRNLSWNEVVKKGTKYYCEDLSRFCDQKMSCIVSTLSWSWPWAEQLLQCFFVAAKCIWLLHLLAFSFDPPLVILRVEEDRAFDPLYMEEIQVERQRPRNPSRVKIMAMPGFYVQDRVLKCRVICRYS